MIGETIDYTYDQLSRLLTANYDGGAIEYTYGYDLAGNLVDNNGTTRTYNAANQMVYDGTNTLTYDANGNLTNDGVNAYTWDRANRMLTAPGSTSYKYDGLSNRIQQTVSSVVTDYLNDVQPGLVKLLRQDDGSNVDHFVHAPRGIHAVDDGTDWMWYMQDGLGSVRGLVDDAAVVQTEMAYDPYGVPDGAYGAGFGYAGEVIDGNGLSYNRARYYSPDMGTWMSLDPLETPNRYAYVGGNPINMVDPSGLNEIVNGVAILDDWIELAFQEALANAPIYSTTDDIVVATAEGVAARAGISMSDDLVVVVAQRISLPGMALRLNAAGVFVHALTDYGIQPNGLFGNTWDYALGTQDLIWDNPATWADIQTAPTPLEQLGIYDNWVDTGTMCQIQTSTSSLVSPQTQTQPQLWPLQERIGEDVSTITETERDNPKRKHIALGLNSTSRIDRQLLWMFTMQLNMRFNPSNIYVYSYGDWQAQGLTDVGNVTGEFDEAFSQAADRAERIHYNLEGIRGNPVDFAENLGNNGVFSLSMNFAAYELYVIRHNPRYCRKTTFWDNGSLNPTPNRIANRQICSV